MSEDSATQTLSAPVLERLVAHHREFLGFLERKLGNSALAEDILQEAFARGLGTTAPLHDEEAAVAWFYRVLRNAVIDQARRRASQQRRLETFAAELEPEAPTAELNAQVCQCVAQLAGTLKPEYAEAVQRVELEGMSMKQFAETAGITSGNAAVRVFRAREALRKQVVRSCGTCAEHGCLDCTCGQPRVTGDS